MRIPTRDPNLRIFLQVGGLAKDEEADMLAVRDYIRPLIPHFTEYFYKVLLSEPQIVPYFEGRIEQLKKTHILWLESLFNGEYGAEFILAQEKIGAAHLRMRIPPLFVTASMSFLRGAMPRILAARVPDAGAAVAATATLLRLLDLCQYLIDRAYDQVLTDNLGISPALLMRLQTAGKAFVVRAETFP
jgi:hypothetical protein